MKSALPTLAALFLCGLSLSGCGGGDDNRDRSVASSGLASSASLASATKGAGRAKLTIKWPARPTSRLIPDAANSIVVEILRGDARQGFDAKVVARPTDPSVPSIVAFDSVPVDKLTLRTTAHPNADGSGTAQASNETPLVIIAGQETDFGTLTLGTTIDHIDIAPPAGGSTTVNTGSSPQQWTATAKDVSGAVVLVNPDKQVWESSDTNVATVDSKTGVVTPAGLQASGTTTIKETDMESGKSASLTLKVVVSGSGSGPGPGPGPGPSPGSPAQFNPTDASYANTLKDGSGNIYVGDWAASARTYTFDTSANPPTLTDITDTNNKTVIATGTLVAKTFGTARTSITYAVFNFPHNIALSASRVTAKGANPLVVLAQGNFSLDTNSSFIVSSGGGDGPGAGQSSGGVYGGGSFGGAGGGPTNGVYGADFISHLQGGSSGAPGPLQGAGGGAIYIGTVGTVTLAKSSISANGGSVLLFGYPTVPIKNGAGSGGGISLWGGGGVFFAEGTLSANGGNVSNGLKSEPFVPSLDGCGGGGGYVVVGYGPNAAEPGLSSVSVVGGQVSLKVNGVAGSDGVKRTVRFGGF